MRTTHAPSITAALLLTAAAIIAPRNSARSDQTFYTGPNNGSWSDGNNWDAATPPVAGDDAVVGQFVPSRSGDVNVTFDADYSSGALNSITLDTTGTSGSVILNQTIGNAMMNATDEYIGTSALNSIYNHSAGSNRFERMYLGFTGSGGGTYNLSGSAISDNFQARTYIGYSGMGVFNQSGGTNNLLQFEIGSLSGSTGTYNLSAGSLSALASGLVGAEGTGVFNQTGGSHTAGGIVTEALSVGPNGTYNLSGGTLMINLGGLTDQAILDNRGTFNLSGNGSVTIPTNGGSFSNNGFLNVSDSPTLNGPVTNNADGTVKTSAALFAFTSTFTNNGSYQSTEDSTQTFTTMTVGSGGDVQGGAGEVFNIGRNFTNNSSQNTAFDLNAAQVTLTGSGVNHRVAWSGADLGPVPAGYQDNFSIGIFELTSGGLLTLVDGDGTPGGALYAHQFILDDGVAQVSSISTATGMNIYYDPNESANAYLGNGTYALNGGGLLSPVIPEPSAVALLFGGVGGLACWLVMMRRRR